METQEPILDFVLRHLDAAKGRLKEVASETGVPYSTICKISQGSTTNPGVRHVQALADYFSAGTNQKAA